LRKDLKTVMTAQQEDGSTRLQGVLEWLWELERRIKRERRHRKSVLETCAKGGTIGQLILQTLCRNVREDLGGSTPEPLRLECGLKRRPETPRKSGQLFWSQETKLLNFTERKKIPWRALKKIETADGQKVRRLVVKRPNGRTGWNPKT